MSELSFAQVGEILQLLQRVDAAEVTVEWGDLKIQVRRGTSEVLPRTQPGGETTPSSAAAHASTTAQPRATSDESDQGPGAADAGSDQALTGTRPQPGLPSTESVPEGRTATETVPEHWSAVTAPMVGTFYRAPTPGERPFVEVGDPVQESDTVALIEVMKLFTEIKAEVAGKIARIDATDGALVEFGQALLWIEPA